MLRMLTFKILTYIYLHIPSVYLLDQYTYSIVGSSEKKLHLCVRIVTLRTPGSVGRETNRLSGSLDHFFLAILSLLMDEKRHIG